MRCSINSEGIPQEVFPVLEFAQGLFGNRLMGVYLYGSAILGGLQQNSDVDILIIINQDLSDADRRDLTQGLLQLSGRSGLEQIKRPLEVTVINQNRIIPWRFPPRIEYMYGEWLRGKMEAGDIPGAGEDGDAAILLWQARSHSYPLKGPEARELLEPIPGGDIRKAIGCSLPELLAGIRGDERNVLLTLARMWFTLATGEICSKAEGADWALPRLPRELADLLKTAARAYAGEGEEMWEDCEAEVTSLAAFMAEAIKNLLNNQQRD